MSEFEKFVEQIKSRIEEKQEEYGDSWGIIDVKRLEDGLITLTIKKVKF